MHSDPLDGLNDEQRAAAQAVRGPVCILAGAGSGKTTTITRRIAVQVSSGAFDASQVLALTFTDRAANQLRERLWKLGINGDVRARTFHAEALAQVAHFTESPQLLPSKASILGPLVRRLPRPYRFRATKDIAAEIERAKNRRVTTDTYLDDLGSHVPSLPPDLMVRVYREYEERKRRADKLDFEDLLEEAIRLMQGNPTAAERIRARYAAFSVDEYQDVNLLQQTLLECWLGGRDDICVVGDDYQSIYGFTGATPRWLLDFSTRYANAKVVTLTHNYRSTPQVLAVANKLTGGLRGREKKLVATRPDGPDVALVEHASGEEETEAIVAEIDRLARAGAPFEEMAILYRINARSDDYEEALAAARIPYQVRDGAFLRRPGPRAALRKLARASGDVRAVDAVTAVATELGWDPFAVPDEASGVEEVTRLADLARLVRLSEEFDGALGTFLDDLRHRFEDESGRGVVLSTYHRAKGLEWGAVFLPRLEERELPFALSRTDDEVAEERRLLYVGITRARSHLRLSWTRSRGGRSIRPSRFLDEIRPGSVVKRAPRNGAAEPSDPDLFARLRAWRKKTAAELDVPAYVVFPDKTLLEICEKTPRNINELGQVSGVGPTKLKRYGSDVLALLQQ
ncbi:MAG TPA: UvrD-helicase domain-containing protein [Actinomycetota bacterium]|jgi:DNA helicase-2/ATP-dependent DNA helicase PcrA|nr:UvrD-helicase domain-containing protein [Actinomycetota bacterium]